MNKIIPGIVNDKELGKLKIESISSKAIFIAPKCYGLLDINQIFKFKVKGLNTEGLSTLTKSDFEMLLNKETQISKSQAKWFRSISESTILVKDTMYTIQQTTNKRELIYNSDNMLIGTKPYVISENKYNLF
jgi:hypothetical protein